MKYLIFLLLILTFISREDVYSQQTQLHSQISKILKHDTEITFDQTPSFLVGVLDQDEFSVERFGNAKVHSPLNIESCFELGALSKILTVLIVKRLVNKEILQLDSPVNSYLPLEYQNPRLAHLTIHDLMYYSSGLPNSLVGLGYKQINISEPFAHFTKEDVLSFYNNYVIRDSLTADHYMDLDYALLGIVIEYATNFDFQANLDNEINAVIGTEFFVTKYEEKEDLVVLGMSKSGIWSSGSDFNVFGPALGVKGSISDLEKLLRFLIYNTSNSEFFNFKNMQHSYAWDKNVLAKDGLYLIEVKKNQKVYASYGHSNIHQVFLGFKANTNTGVVIAANSSTGTKDLGILVLKMINNNWKRKI
jgi:CubicO group peptidase (beta-lactamase class C family)